MPAKNKKEKQINLLPQEEFAESTLGRVLHWLLSTFRYLVITTEMIVITAFISRFYFDSRLGDLNEEMTQKKEFIESDADFEKEFRLVQRKLQVLSAMTDDSRKMGPHLSDITSRLPTDVAINLLTIISEDKIQVHGQSLSEKSISQLAENLKSVEKFSSVTITQISRKANETAIEFSIEVSLKREGVS